MKDALVALVPFTLLLGCASQSSTTTATAVASTSSSTQHHKTHHHSNITSLIISNQGRQSRENEKRRKDTTNLCGLQQLLVKSFSHIFVYKEEVEEEEIEMEIGFPTDVKHVGHVGLDGSTTINPQLKGGWENIMLPSISESQFQLAMTSQSQVE